MRRLLAPLLALAIVSRFFTFFFTGDSSAQVKERTLIRDIIYSQGSSDGFAAARIEGLLNDLTELNPDAGKRWQEIVRYWEYANHTMEVNSGTIPDDWSDSDDLCIVVLGYQIAKHGRMAPELIDRLEIALKCAEKYPNAYILCTGGSSWIDPEVTEAGMMGEWLVKHGLDSKRLLLEDQAMTTAENAIFSYTLLRNQYPEVSKLAIVSSDYHVPWAALLFQAQCILEAKDWESPYLTVAYNAACETLIPETYSPYQNQAIGLMTIAGFD